MLPLCVLISLVLHGVFLSLSGSLWWREDVLDKPLLLVPTVDVELSSLDGLAHRSAIDRSSIGSEIRVPKNTLPQLVDDLLQDQNISDSLSKDSRNQDGETVSLQNIDDSQWKDAAKLSSSKDKESRDQQKKRAYDRLVKLKSEEMLRRMLKEKARLEKRFSDRVTSPRTSESKAKDLKDASFAQDTAAAFTLEHESFHRAVRLEIGRFYALPEVYRRSHLHLSATLQVVFDKDGIVLSQSIRDSSQDVIFDEIAMESVQKASFPAPPKDLVGKVVLIYFQPNT